MLLNRLMAIGLSMLIIVSAAVAATAVQERRVKKVKRVKRPAFTQRDWDGIYFENLFEEGLVGSRPQMVIPGTKAKTDDRPNSDQESSADGQVAFAWSNQIGRETLEDEVKQLHKRLMLDITTPVKFKSEYANVHQSYSVLSMMFGIIREYDDEVRWQKFAGKAQASFERAAANSRVGTIQAYESCKRRKEDLGEMIRGGNFAADDQVPESLDWSAVVERAPAMQRLEIANENLKQLTANKGEFTREMAKLLHEAEIIAATAVVLARENMTDADDDGYREFSLAMNRAALEFVQACKNQDYDAASRAANKVSQSCDDCHGEWR